VNTVHQEDTRVSGRSVARFAHRISWSELPEPVRHRARLALRDSVGTMVAGSVTAAAKTAAAASEADGTGPIELLATGRRVPRISGALANAVAASSMDFDDGHVLGGSIHPGGAIVPALLAAGADRGCTLRQALEGLVAAYEVSIRAGYLLWPEDRSYQAHLAGTPAAIGGAIGCAKLLGLPAEGLQRALEIGWAHAPLARLQFPMVKESLGWAAATSVGSALLADAGFKRLPSLDATPFGSDAHPPTGFDLPKAAREEFVGELGERWELQNTYFKPYAACRFTHTAAEALAGLWETAPDADSIVEITVSTHREAAYLNSQRPTTIEEAQYSFPWVIASMVLDREVGPLQINETRLEDSAMQSVAERVTVEHDSTMDSSYPAAYPCRVRAVMRSGEVFEAELEVPLGAPERPMSDEQLERKFRRLVEPRLDAPRSREISELIMSREDASVDHLLALLSSSLFSL
jgi:2-methylcitrate dehydratase PrpD